MCQAAEYTHAYHELGLTLGAGVYGATFMLTGFHGLHVTLGAIMLIVMLGRADARPLLPERHFAFGSGGVVLALRGRGCGCCCFVFVYWL